jgi:hypothetical protein
MSAGNLVSASMERRKSMRGRDRRLERLGIVAVARWRTTDGERQPVTVYVRRDERQ